MKYHRDKSTSMPLVLWSIGSAAVRSVEPMSTVILLEAGTLAHDYDFGNRLLSIYTMSGAIMAIVLARIYDKSAHKRVYICCISTLTMVSHILLAFVLVKRITAIIIYFLAILSAVIPSALPGIARVILSSMGGNSVILALDAINVEIAWICGPIIAAWVSKTNNIPILISTLIIAYFLAAITLTNLKQGTKNLSPSPSRMPSSTQQITFWSFSQIFSRKVLLSLVDSFSIGLVEMAVIVSLPLILWRHPHPISLTGILVSFLSLTGIVGGVLYWKYAHSLPFQINTQTFLSLLIISILCLLILLYSNLPYITIILGAMGFFITQLNTQRAISLEKAIDPAFYAQGSTAQYAGFALGAALASYGMSYLHNYRYLLILAVIIAIISSLCIRNMQSSEKLVDQ